MARTEFPKWQIAGALPPGESFQDKESGILYVNPKVEKTMEETQKLYYESDRMFYRYKCKICNCEGYNRCGINKTTGESGYYCRNHFQELVDIDPHWELACATVSGKKE